MREHIIHPPCSARPFFRLSTTKSYHQISQSKVTDIIYALCDYRFYMPHSESLPRTNLWVLINQKLDKTMADIYCTPQNRGGSKWRLNTG